MEEIKYKILNGSPAVLESAIVKVVEIIVRKCPRESGSSSQVHQELQLLWTHCKSPNPVLAHLSCGAITDLIVEGILPLGPSLSTFLSIAPQVICPEGLISSIGKILDIQDKVDKKRKPYAIASNQHPFISLLRSFPNCWPHIHGQIRDRVNPPASTLAPFKPVFLYVFCDPNHHQHFGAFRSALKDLLFDIMDEVAGAREMLWSIVTWNTYDQVASLYENAAIVHQIMEKTEKSADVKALITSSLIAHSARLGVNPNAQIGILKSSLAEHEVKEETANLVVILLSQAVSQSSSKHHSDLLEIVLFLATKGSLTRLVLARFAMSILEFISHMQKIDSILYKNLKILFQMGGNKFGKEFSQVDSLECVLFDANIAEASEAFSLLIKLEKSDDAALRWLQSLSQSGVSDLTNFYPTMLSIAFATNDSETCSVAFKLLMKSGRENPKLSHGTLSLIMHKLSQNNSPDIQHCLLQSLPALGADKCSISFIIQLINSLAIRPGLKPIRLKLLFDLWREEDRVYLYLQRALEEATPDVNKIEYLLAKAKVIRDICKIQAKEHGAELLPLLSKLLNECKVSCYFSARDLKNIARLLNAIPFLL